MLNVLGTACYCHSILRLSSVLLSLPTQHRPSGAVRASHLAIKDHQASCERGTLHVIRKRKPKRLSRPSVLSSFRTMRSGQHTTVPCKSP